MKNLCIIPARGGSKRIIKKNIIDFLGKPLLAYSIENALNSKIFDEVILSSDDEKIIEIGLRYGAKAPFKRDKNLSDDHSPSTAVTQNAIRLLAQEGYNYDNICTLYPTAPLINAKILVSAYEQFLQEGSEFLFAAASFDHPIERAFYLDEKRRVHMFDESHYKSRSQDLRQSYHDAGAFYFGKSQAWLQNDLLFQSCSTVYLLPRHLVCDINTMEDLEFAKMLYRLNQCL